MTVKIHKKEAGSIACTTAAGGARREPKPLAPAKARRASNRETLAARGKKHDYLSTVELFRGLARAELNEIERATVMRSFKRGSLFYTPGETGEVLFIIKAGAVQIFKRSPEGKKLIIAKLPQYTFFGEMRSVGQKMFDTFAEVTEDSLICTLRRPELESLLLSKPRVTLRLLEAVSKRVIELEQKLAELAFESLIPRLASLLMHEAEGDEVKGLSHQDIAERLGVYRETATNALSELKMADLIRIGRRHITILDPKGLARVACA